VRLYLIRHADAAPGEPDELRTLTPEGREAARALGERLTEERLDAVLSSPLLRARETAEAIASACGVGAEVDERLAPGTTAEAVREAAAAWGERVAAVAHQPDCSNVAVALTGRDPGFPAGGMLTIDLPG
jgi:phosphohistidine phosphatase